VQSANQKGNEAMRKAFKNTALALGISGAMALAVTTPLSAAPVPSATLALPAAAPDHTTNVYWRGRWGWGWGGGLLAAGLAAGFVGAAATAAYGGYYPYPAYAYPYPAYAYATYPVYPVAPYYYARPYWGGFYRRPYWRARYYARPWGYRRYAWGRW
jgi:hypothetical protein